jgi:hypothetical protein
MYSHTILFHPSSDLWDRRESLRTLERLRDGWRPTREILATARRAERWTINRTTEAPVYQFIGYRGEPAARSSLVIATLLAIDPAAIDRAAIDPTSSAPRQPQDGWALLAGNSWVLLGRASPDLPALDPAVITQRAEDWLRAQ